MKKVLLALFSLLAACSGEPDGGSAEAGKNLDATELKAREIEKAADAKAKEVEDEAREQVAASEVQPAPATEE